MTESFTLSLFVYPHFLCTTCVALWLFVPWKRCGRGAMSLSYFTSCPSKNTAVRQTRTCKKSPDKSRKLLLRRASDSHFFFCRRQVTNPTLVTNSTDKLVNLTSLLDKLTCHPALCTSLKQLTSYNLSSWQVLEGLLKSTKFDFCSRRASKVNLSEVGKLIRCTA